jgi:hypothetical protein
MRVSIILYSYLREKLPPETRGRTVLELPEGSCVADAFRQLDLPAALAWSLNGSLQRDQSLPLHDGDELQAFRQGAGG